ncbi:MAG: response regulator [Anaerosomatales bacterium]|nr:response regulator [Anaerosomatales bacterium]MDT8435035.1 response regulator [Anaerosomatales bacterium]
MTRKILAVDDEPSIVRLVSAALTAKGFEVATAHDGQDALDKVALEKPDLIVLDIMMPRMDGREVARRLAANPKTAKIPIVFLSAIGDLDSQLDTLEELKDVEYMTKPFDVKELGDYVEAMLDPKKRAELAHHRSRQVGKLRTMVEIMHRKRETS